jgi:2-hydroxychromene-2-carboxylate isomerase
VPTIVEVYADITCPFTHVGLRRFVEQRSSAGRDDLKLRVRAWPLELVNGEPLDAHFVEDEIDEIRPQVAPLLFAGFDPATFPASSLTALALADAAYEHELDVGERVSLELRSLLFEEGTDVSDPSVLVEVARRHKVTAVPDSEKVLADYERGIRRGVQGSPHFFVGVSDFFCPGLDVRRDDEGHLRVTANPDSFDRFITAAL